MRTNASILTICCVLVITISKVHAGWNHRYGLGFRRIFPHINKIDYIRLAFHCYWIGRCFRYFRKSCCVYRCMATVTTKNPLQITATIQFRRNRCVILATLHNFHNFVCSLAQNGMFHHDNDETGVVYNGMAHRTGKLRHNCRAKILKQIGIVFYVGFAGIVTDRARWAAGDGAAA